MTLQSQKTMVIEQFKQVNDINLIMAIQSMLDFARKINKQVENVPAEHKKIVRHRIKTADKSKFLDWDKVQDNFIFE